LKIEEIVEEISLDGRLPIAKSMFEDGIHEVPKSRTKNKFSDTGKYHVKI